METFNHLFNSVTLGERAQGNFAIRKNRKISDNKSEIYDTDT